MKKGIPTREMGGSYGSPFSCPQNELQVRRIGTGSTRVDSSTRSWDSSPLHHLDLM
ncbi:hypothetical protein JAAARDRAFT_629072 [Jaapia argillacea MUCL 33604]|uniref:Uncharacterized protein n=1 Tax=Jaapia argillacea MUCL 33604 TaxID=933084 RepID=A0A067Q0K2_9AGAM|nr:hypothetical protein JAAARDRAFT_629072 [Jaapia argillacea MUCL 33604]